MNSNPFRKALEIQEIYIVCQAGNYNNKNTFASQNLVGGLLEMRK
jgi:hypothetical protein